MTENMNDGDVVVTVQLPKKDYQELRTMIEERQALNGLRKWITTRFLWGCGIILTGIGAFEALKRLGAE